MYKRILSIDTSFQQTSIAIFNENYIDEEIHQCYYNHEKNILTMINSILKRNRIHIKDFEIITFANGPGNFTSIRLGASIAQGLSIPYNIPIIGISTLKLLAEQAWRIKKIKNVIICIATKNKYYFWAQYKKNEINIWKSKEKELLLNHKEIYEKISNIKKKIYIISFDYTYLKNFNNMFIRTLNIKTSYSKDLISLLLSLQYKPNCQFNKININYLINPKYK